MPTVNQFVRSYSAAVKRLERVQQKNAREAAKMFKLQAKQSEIQNASQAVAQYDNYINVLTSVHKNSTSVVNWQYIVNEAPPIKPTPINKRELEAELKLKNYHPSFLDRLFKRDVKKVQILKQEIEKAIMEDENASNKLLIKYAEKLDDYNVLHSIADKVISNDPEGYKLATEYFEIFNDLIELGCDISVNFTPEIITASVKIQGTEIIPTYILKQTTTGKLTKKEIPNSKFNELYQDYVCSVALRVSIELTNYFKIKFAVVNIFSEILNVQTGLLENQIILSVAIPPETLNKLNLSAIDPSESMKNFIHNMVFSKTNGFTPVNEVKVE